MGVRGIGGGMGDFFKSVASLGKVLLKSRWHSIRRSDPGSGPSPGSGLTVLANGPSLRGVLDTQRDRLLAANLMTVNFAPNTPEFAELRPLYHVMADGVLFDAAANDNVRLLWENLRKVSWPLTLCIPFGMGKDLVKTLPSCVRVVRFNLTPAEGYRWLIHTLFRLGLAMPRPRNVLIPALMTGIREGFKEIVIHGADHSWSQSLWVDDNNRVVTVQPHFYKDNDKEHRRVEELYKDIHLHDIFLSFSIAFRSYFAVRDYADSRGVRILNATPGSFIDAFPRI